MVCEQFARAEKYLPSYFARLISYHEYLLSTQLVSSLTDVNTRTHTHRSSRNVRRRTAEAEESKRAAERRRRRRKGGNGEVHQQQLRRARVWEAPLLGGLLMREAGVTSSPPFHSSSSSDYSCFSTTGSGSDSGRGSGSWETTTATTTSLVGAWTAGLRDKGAVRVWSAAREGSDVMVSALWVGAGDDERSGAPGLGVAYAAVGETYLAASYVPRDGEDK